MNATLDPKVGTTYTAGRTIVQTRILKAPRTLVWKAWTDPKHLLQWYGPKGFTLTTHELNVREGGVWRFMMHGPDGTDFPNVKRFTRVQEPEIMEFVQGSEDEPEMFQVSISFEDLGNGQTVFTMRHLFPTEEALREVVEKFGALEGGRQTLDRLEQELARQQGMPEPDELFTISRQVNAPRRLVWDVFTKAGHLAQWWGPKGPSLEVVSLNLRPAGIFHYAMVPPAGDNTYGTQGGKAYGRFLYREVEEPARLVLISSFADSEGNAIPAPFPGFPLEVLNEWTFTEHDGKTTIRLQGGPLNATPEERALFRSMTASMEQGFGGTFEKLDEYLASMR